MAPSAGLRKNTGFRASCATVIFHTEYSLLRLLKSRVSQALLFVFTLDSNYRNISGGVDPLLFLSYVVSSGVNVAVLRMDRLTL